MRSDTFFFQITARDESPGDKHPAIHAPVQKVAGETCSQPVAVVVAVAILGVVDL